MSRVAFLGAARPQMRPLTVATINGVVGAALLLPAPPGAIEVALVDSPA